MFNKVTYTAGLLLSLSLTNTAGAALLSRLGGMAYYDDVLDITWVADPKLAGSNTFGLNQSANVYDQTTAVVGSTGRVTIENAHLWISGMNTTGYLGKNDWRLPTLSSVNGGALGRDFSNNGTTDWGYGATGIGWQTQSGAYVSELGYMYYANLASLGALTPDDNNPQSAVAQPGSGLAGSNPFAEILELPQSAYWFDKIFEFDSAYTWGFNFDFGRQSEYIADNSLFPWAVRDGDIAPVPVPGALWMFGTAMLGLFRLRRSAYD